MWVIRHLFIGKVVVKDELCSGDACFPKKAQNLQCSSHGDVKIGSIYFPLGVGENIFVEIIILSSPCDVTIYR